MREHADIVTLIITFNPSAFTSQTKDIKSIKAYDLLLCALGHTQDPWLEN